MKLNFTLFTLLLAVTLLWLSACKKNNTENPTTGTFSQTPTADFSYNMSSAKGDSLCNPDGMVTVGGILEICNTGPTSVPVLTLAFVAK